MPSPGSSRFLIRQGRFGEALGHLGEARDLGREIDVAEVVVLASAYLALSPDQDVAEARSTFEKREPLLGIPAKMEARHALWKAGSDPADLREAHELLDFLCEHAPEDCRDSMIQNVPLHREIAEAWKEHGA